MSDAERTRTSSEASQLYQVLAAKRQRTACRPSAEQPVSEEHTQHQSPSVNTSCTSAQQVLTGPDAASTAQPVEVACSKIAMPPPSCPQRHRGFTLADTHPYGALSPVVNKLSPSDCQKDASLAAMRSISMSGSSRVAGEDRSGDTNVATLTSTSNSGSDCTMTAARLIDAIIFNQINRKPATNAAKTSDKLKQGHSEGSSAVVYANVARNSNVAALVTGDVLADAAAATSAAEAERFTLGDHINQIISEDYAPTRRVPKVIATTSAVLASSLGGTLTTASKLAVGDGILAKVLTEPTTVSSLNQQEKEDTRRPRSFSDAGNQLQVWRDLRTPGTTSSAGSSESMVPMAAASGAGVQSCSASAGAVTAPLIRMPYKKLSRFLASSASASTTMSAQPGPLMSSGGTLMSLANSGAEATDGVTNKGSKSGQFTSPSVVSVVITSAESCTSKTLGYFAVTPHGSSSVCKTVKQTSSAVGIEVCPKTAATASSSNSEAPSTSGTGMRHVLPVPLKKRGFSPEMTAATGTALAALGAPTVSNHVSLAPPTLYKATEDPVVGSAAEGSVPPQPSPPPSPLRAAASIIKQQHEQHNNNSTKRSPVTFRLTNCSNNFLCNPSLTSPAMAAGSACAPTAKETIDDSGFYGLTSSDSSSPPGDLQIDLEVPSGAF